MSDPVIISIIGAIVTVIQSTLTILSGRRTRKAVKENAKRHDENVAALHREVQQLQVAPATPRLADGIRTSRERPV